jgi:hypothetical protein
VRGIGWDKMGSGRSIDLRMEESIDGKEDARMVGEKTDNK